MSDFVELLWLFNSLRETRNIIRLDLHEAGLLYKYAEKTWIEPFLIALEICQHLLDFLFTKYLLMNTTMRHPHMDFM